MTADHGSAIVLQHGFGRILLIGLQFAMELDRNRVEVPPPVDHSEWYLVSFAQFGKLVQETPRDEITSAFLLQTAYLGRDVADPFTAVMPHLVVGIGKNKAFVQFSIEHGRQPVNRDFDPLGKQDIDILYEHFYNPVPAEWRPDIPLRLSVRMKWAQCRLLRETSPPATCREPIVTFPVIAICAELLRSNKGLDNQIISQPCWKCYNVSNYPLKGALHERSFPAATDYRTTRSGIR